MNLIVTVYRQVISEPKSPYESLLVSDFGHLECEA